jgi:hypothetical protein
VHDRLLIPGAEAFERLVEHEEQGLAGFAFVEAFDLLGAFRRGDENLGAAIPHDIGDLVLFQVAADRGVVEPASLRGPAYLHEGQAILHQQSNVVAGLEAERAKQMRALIR